MIDFTLCKKCKNCLELSPSEFNDRGEFVVLSSVECEIGGLLLMKSEVPEGCPFVLEHLMSQDKLIEDLIED